MVIKPSFTIIGTGFIFPRHVSAIQAVGGEIADVVNNFNGKNAEWIRKLLETESKYVVVLTPNCMHADMVLIARRMNKIVLCEKPLAINSAQVQMLTELGEIFVVLQLRYHPLVKEIQKHIEKAKKKIKIGMDIGVYRDPEYFTSWKGHKIKSGGLLFNLGIHYFDLLLHLFGPAKKVKMKYCDERVATGTIEGAKYVCEWRLSVADNKDAQRRTFTIEVDRDKKEYNFSSKDNLSYENLHVKVYEDLLKGRGVTPAEALKSIQLVEKLYATEFNTL